MKIVFFGTPDYVLPVLEDLHRSFSIETVVTQPPKPTGRNKKLTPSPVDVWAKKKNIKIIYELNDLKNAESKVAVLAAYGRIVPKEVIHMFPKGIINIHPSLLPKYRGASPIQAAIAAGETSTGVSIMKLDSLMDHGSILHQFKEEIKKDDTTEILRKRAFEKASEVLTKMLPKYVEGKIEPKEQDHKRATYTKMIKKSDGFIPPEYLDSCMKTGSLKKEFEIPFIKEFKVDVNSRSLNNFIRAMDPWPSAWTYVKTSPDAKEKRLKILKTRVENKKLILDGVQLEGKTRVSWKEFITGYPEFKF